MSCDQLNYLGVAALGSYSVLEYWFGKTKKTKANSLIEFLALVVSLVIVKLMKGKQNEQ